MNTEHGKDILMRAVLYLRVSSEEQVANFSIDTQRDICIQEAQRKGYEIAREFVESGKSAKNITGRPELLELLEYCQQKKNDIGAVITYRIDRISRSVTDYLAIRKTLAEHGVTILSTSEPTGSSPTETMIETILASVAQLDNAVKSERTTNGMKKRFLSGLPPSRPPVGYRSVDGIVSKDPETFGIVQQAWHLMASGTTSISHIATILQSEGIPMRKGAVSKLFRNAFYMGVMRSPKWKTEVKGTHIPMISESTYYKVQAILEGKSASQITRPHIRDNELMPLRGALYCPTCGKPFTGAYSTGKSGKKFLYYFCPKRCKGMNVSGIAMEKRLREIIESIEPTQKMMNAFKIRIYVDYTTRINLLKGEQREADRELLALQAKYNTLVEKNLSGLYSDEIFKQEEAKIKNQRLVLELVKNEGKIDRYSLEEIEHFITAMLNNLWRLYEQSNLHQKRVLMSSMFTEKLVVENKTIRTPQIGTLFAVIAQKSPFVPKSVHSSNTDQNTLTALYNLMDAYPRYMFANL